jgi:hypothetical protein
VLLSVPLATFAVVGWFIRYAADDYCTAAQLVTSGVLAAQSHLYTGWSGRFSASLFNTSLELFGVGALRLVPALALVVWVAAATWTIHLLAHRLGWRLPVSAAAALAALLVYATLAITADLPQDLYWQTGLVTYLLPLILATGFVGWLARPGSSAPMRYAVAFVLALVAGGTSETFAAAQVVAIGLAVAATLLARERRLTGMLAAGLLGAVIAAGVVAIAPGNEVRQATGARTPLSVAVPLALEFTQGWLRLTFARPHAAELALLVAIPAATAALTGRSSARASMSPMLLLAVLAGALVVVFACVLPAYYALSTNPPGRAQLTPEYVVVCALALVGWWLGATLAGHLRRVLRLPLVAAAACLAVLALVALGPLRTAAETLGQLSAASAYAAEWDARDTRIRADRDRGVEAVTVAPLPSTGSVQNLDWVGPDRDDWFNQCVAGYYGVNSIAASPGV